MEKLIKERLQLLHSAAPDCLGDLLRLELIGCDSEKGEYILRAKTESWMRNVAGTLHGGMCATIVDQAMGSIAHCLMPGEGNAFTTELQVTYHRPLIPGEDVRIKVRALSATKNLIRLTSELYRESAPEKLCTSASGTWFYKPFQE